MPPPAIAKMRRYFSDKQNTHSSRTMPRMKALFLPWIIALSISPVFAQTDGEAAQPVGTVIEKIATREDKEQSYAAYLPSGYTPEKKWPAIFCFDPRARGKFAVEHFQKAAEKYGYIVLCSNNSRNGLEADLVTKIVAAFDRDAHERFSIDEKRTYAAGFSGGARLAVGLALRCRGCLAGVIAAGAGFPGDVQPSAPMPFAFFGAAGFDDFNFTEMRDLGRKFEGLPNAYRFETFAGGHEWIDPDTAEKALAWFDLQAMKNGARLRNPQFIEEQFALRSREADDLLGAKRLIDAHLAYSSLARDFDGLLDVSKYRRTAEDLKNSSGFKKETKAENELADRQMRVAGEIISLWLKKAAPESEGPDQKQDARTKLSDLRKRQESAADTPDRRLARRTLFGLFVRAIETAQGYIRQKNYASAAEQYELARAADPKNAGAAYESARVYALDKRKKAALEALEDAMRLGFKNLSLLKSDGAFTSISNEPRFLKLIEGVN